MSVKRFASQHSDLYIFLVNLPENDDYFTKYKFPSFQNHYVEVSKDVNLGVWHILPEIWAYEALHNPKFDYQEALNSPYPVMIYFHGTGEARNDNGRTYQLLTRFFHVIAFDYRGKYKQVID